MSTAHCLLPTANLSFPLRPRIETLGGYARRRIWTSRCGRFRVVHSHVLYGRGTLPDVWRAERRDQFGWTIVSKHRKREPAFAACRKAAE